MFRQPSRPDTSNELDMGNNIVGALGGMADVIHVKGIHIGSSRGGSQTQECRTFRQKIGPHTKGLYKAVVVKWVEAHLISKANVRCEARHAQP